MMRSLRNPFLPLESLEPAPADAARVGDYYHTDRRLYRVEYVTAERALVEDCRHGTLIDVPLADLRRFTRVGRPGDIGPAPAAEAA
jgi:hypothetical protein